jgi:hypothetical protein
MRLAASQADAYALKHLAVLCTTVLIRSYNATGYLMHHHKQS